MRITKHTLKKYSADTKIKNVVYKYSYVGDRLVWERDVETTIGEALKNRENIRLYCGKIVTIDAELA